MPVECLLCHSTSKNVLYRFEFGKILECGDCGFVYTASKSETKLVECRYNRRYYKNKDEGSCCGYQDYFGKERQLRIQVAQVFVRMLTSLGKSNGKLLDVGCGGGFLVHEAISCGWDATGIDLSKYAVQRASSFGSGHILQGTLRDHTKTHLNNKQYDAITMFDVIEHLKNPLREIEYAHSLLSPGGILVLVTPIYGGWLSHEQGARYVQFKKDHIYHFTLENMKTLLQLSAFTNFKIRRIADVLAEIKDDVSRDVLEKYRDARESMLVVCERYPASDSCHQ